MRIGIATDHGGFDLKEELVKQLRGAGHEVVEFGAVRRRGYSNGDDQRETDYNQCSVFFGHTEKATGTRFYLTERKRSS